MSAENADGLATRAFSTLERRTLLTGLLPATLTLCAAIDAGPAASATPPSLDNATETWLRLVCDPAGRTTFAVTEGLVWGFKPQADDLTTDAFAKRLYGYRNLVVRKAGRGGDGALTLRTKAWSFYTDPVSGESVNHILNPYTGAQVACPPLSGPASVVVYGREAAAAPPLDLRQRRIGDRAFLTVVHVSRFRPADTTWFKLEADMTSYTCLAADLDRAGGGFVPSTWSHNLVAEWQTWMRMHGTPGHILFKGDGCFVSSLEAVPAPLLADIERAFPTTLDAVRAWN